MKLIPVTLLLLAGCAGFGNQQVANDLMNQFQQCSMSTPKNNISICSSQYYDGIQRSFNQFDPQKPVYLSMATKLHQVFQDIESGRLTDPKVLQQRRMRIESEFTSEIQVVNEREQKKASDKWQQFVDSSNKAKENNTFVTPPPTYTCRNIGNVSSCSPN